MSFAFLGAKTLIPKDIVTILAPIWYVTVINSTEAVHIAQDW